ncbi:MAG: cobalamin-dependent protein [Ilumatobacteraceae bacterium]|nr:cobalamin-dependent protein [Ilumatobacteraceae bacterium]
MSDDLTAARLGVTAALREGDAALAYRLVIDLMHDGTPMPVIIEEVFAPIQVESGDRWATGDVTISEEHVATAAVETLIAMLAGSFDQPVDTDTVVVVCAEGDDHTLPARMAAALLSYEGYRTLFLGTSVPADDLADYLRSADAEVLVVSCTRPANLLGARACVAAGHAAGVPVAVGGRAFAGGAHWEAIGADGYAATLSDLGVMLARWRPDPATAEHHALPLGPPTIDIVTRRTQLASDVADALDHADASAVARRVAQDVADELVDVLAVAVHLDERTLLADQAGLLRALLAEHAGVEIAPDQLLARLAAAVETALGSGHAALVAWIAET